MKILDGEERTPALDVLEALKKRVGRDGIVLAVADGVIGRSPKRPHPKRARRTGLGVQWQDPKTGKKHRTAWASIRDRRLARLRKIVVKQKRES